LTSLVGIPPPNCNYRASNQTAQTFNKIPSHYQTLSTIVSCHPGLVKSKFPQLVQKKVEIKNKKRRRMQNGKNAWKQQTE
jgi:hypothetical protein